LLFNFKSEKEKYLQEIESMHEVITTTHYKLLGLFEINKFSQEKFGLFEIWINKYPINN